MNDINSQKINFNNKTHGQIQRNDNKCEQIHMLPRARFHDASLVPMRRPDNASCIEHIRETSLVHVNNMEPTAVSTNDS